MDLNLIYLIQGAALGLSAAATPGPLQTFLISQTLFGGWKRGAPVAFAPLVSDPLLVFLIVFILDQLPPTFLTLISVFGGLFALNSAYGLFRAWEQNARSGGFKYINQVGITQDQGAYNTNNGENSPPAEHSTLRVLGKGVIMNVMSPGLYMFWALINGPLLLSAIEESTLSGVAFLAGFYTVLTGGLLLLVLLFNFARLLGGRVVQLLTLCSILILVAFGIILIYQGLIRIIA